MTSVPWLCLRDFNEVLVQPEKLGGNLCQNSLMQAFQHTLETCKLTDLGFNGPKYTWSNCQERDALVKEQLDRGVANAAWQILFPETEVTVSSSTFSDHAPLFVALKKYRGLKRSTPRFFFRHVGLLRRDTMRSSKKIGAKSTLLDQARTDWEPNCKLVSMGLRDGGGGKGIMTRSKFQNCK
jgi:hypothetical protein